MTTLLVVEDDKSILSGLAMNLRFEGYDVQTAVDGAVGLSLASRPGLDLIVLDVMLPTLNGFEVLRELRKRGSRVPVVVLSAKQSEPDKVMALDLGADDYVTKPFGLAELVARIKAVLRRRAPGQPLVRIGECDIDLAKQQVTRAGEPVAMTAQEFRLLRVFLDAEGRALSREHLLEAAWGLAYEGTERTVDNFVRALRVKFERDPERPRHFVTVRGVGYRFEK